MFSAETLVLPFNQVGIEAIAAVGGKNASLGEMIRELAEQGVRVPGGFATTAGAYRHLLRTNGLDGPLRALLAGLDTEDLSALQAAGKAARALLLNVSLPADLSAAILAAYRELATPDGVLPAVAVRSSATAEDLPDASFAGQQETFLNIQGEQPCCRPAGVATRRCSPTGPSPTANSMALTTWRWPFRSVCSAWCAPTWPALE